MALSQDDLRKLRGLLNRTGSDNDHEALASIRAAAKLPLSRGYSWDLLLDRAVRVVQEVETSVDGADWNELFELALSSAHGSFRETLLSIHTQWERQHFLSERHSGGRVR